MLCITPLLSVQEIVNVVRPQDLLANNTQLPFSFFFRVLSRWSLSIMRTCLSLVKSRMKACLSSMSVVGRCRWFLTRQLSMNDRKRFDLWSDEKKQDMMGKMDDYMYKNVTTKLLFVLCRGLLAQARNSLGGYWSNFFYVVGNVSWPNLKYSYNWNLFLYNYFQYYIVMNGTEHENKNTQQ